MTDAAGGCVYFGNFLPAAEWLWNFRGSTFKAVGIEDPTEAVDLVRWARQKRIPCLRVSSADVLDCALHEIGPLDWGLAANFGLILSPASLARFRIGVVNIHPGLLPQDTGRNPVTRHWNDPHRHFGVTLHWMTPQVDQGPILAQVQMPQGFAPPSPSAATRHLYLTGLQHLDAHKPLFL